VTVILLEVTLIVAIFYPKILILFSILGGFCCGIIVLVLPSKTYAGLLKIKTEGWDEKNWKAICYKYGSILLFLLGTTGAILSVLGIA
jgi:amino acid permease